MVSGRGLGCSSDRSCADSVDSPGTAGDLRVEAIVPEDYFDSIESAKSRGVMGGLIYEAIHAEVARRLAVEKLYTFNTSNFEHVAPDLKIVRP